MDGYYSRPRLLYTGPSSWRLFSTLLVMLTSSFQIAFSSEIYLNGTTSAIVSGSSSFPPTNPQNYHLGFSFRTCRQLLLQQQNNNSPVLLSQVQIIMNIVIITDAVDQHCTMMMHQRECSTVGSSFFFPSTTFYFGGRLVVWNRGLHT